MGRYAASLSQHPVATHAVGEAAGEILEAFGGDEPDLLVCFASPHFVGAFEDVAHALTGIFDPRVVLGMTAVSIIGGAREVEHSTALSLFAARFDDATLTPVSLSVQATPDGPTVVGRPELEHEREPATLLLLADPFSFPVDGFLRALRQDLPNLQVIGGAASAARGPGGNRLLLTGARTANQGAVPGSGPGEQSVRTAGAVGVLLDGVEVRAVVSQGCRPIGKPYVVTRASGNRIEELAGRAAIDRLQDCASEAHPDDLELMRRGLHVGLVVDENQAEFGRGDFLVRNVMSADSATGAIVVGDEVKVGQTVQFHVRDATAADEDLRLLLDGVEAAAALLFTCNGRGAALFGVGNHDAGVVDRLLGPLPVAGAFCAGEIGPVGGKSFLHGFTAGLALFG